MEADQSEKEAVMEAINKRLPELDKWISRPEWKILEETAEYKLFYLDEESGLRSIKSEIIIEKPMKTIYDYICDISTKVNYDHSFECGQDVTKFDDNYYLQYYKYKGKLVFSPRDFFVANYRTYSEDFCELFGTNFASDKHPAFYKIERAELIYGGFRLKKVEKGKILVTYYTLGDMHINQYLINTTLREVAYQVKYLKDILMKQP